MSNAELENVLGAAHVASEESKIRGGLDFFIFLLSFLLKASYHDSLHLQLTLVTRYQKVASTHSGLSPAPLLGPQKSRLGWLLCSRSEILRAAPWDDEKTLLWCVKREARGGRVGGGN